MSNEILIKPTDGDHIVNPETAQYWLTNHQYEFQRPIRTWHVNNLASELSRGRFRDRTQVCFCLLDGKYYLVNGQHTLSAIVKSGVSHRLSVVVTVVRSKEGIADEFARHDTHLTRQLSVSLHAHEMHVEFQCSRNELNTIASGSIYYAYSTGRHGSRVANNTTNDEKVAILREYKELSLMALPIWREGRGKPFITRKTTVATMMHTLAKEEVREIATSFWVDLIRDDGLLRTDPRKILLEFLRDHCSSSGGGSSSSSGKAKLPERYLVKAISIGWNAFVDGKTFKVIRPSFDGTGSIVDFKLCGQFRA